ncbi:MAG: YbaB/EbfC family nucleoid-associated protein [Alphaproteobacteria bacterium]
MKNLGQMLKQAQKMQADMQAAQERLAEAEVTGQAGGGMVEAVVSGKGELRKVRIDPALVSGEDVEVLEDLIVAAVNDGRQKAEAMASEEMSKVTGGLELPPGINLPF